MILGLVGLRLVELGLVELGFVELGFIELGLVELGFVELGLVELGLVELGHWGTPLEVPVHEEPGQGGLEYDPEHEKQINSAMVNRST